MLSTYFYGFILSFIGGVALESVCGFGYASGLLFAFVGALILLLSLRVGNAHKSLVVSLALIACALGVLRVDVAQTKQEFHALDMFLGSSVTLEGLVVDEPDVRDTYTNVVLDVTSVRDANKNYKAPSRTLVLVRAPLYPELAYGDKVSLAGVMKAPQQISSSADRASFDYVAYLHERDISYQSFFPKITVIEHNQGNILQEKLFAVKRILLDHIEGRIPEPEAALGGGIILGAQQSLGSELVNTFRIAGLSHIVVLSGYNITIIVSALALLLAPLRFQVRIGVAILAVTLFAAMVGGGATVIRALIMVSVVLLARIMGREAHALRALMLALFVMVFIAPGILLHDVSFQLSFLATLALVLIAPRVDPFFGWMHEGMLREIIVTTLSVEVLVLPLIMYYMGTLSLVGIVANILVLPVMPFAMLATFLVSILGTIPLLGSFLGAVAFGVLWYVVHVAELLAAVPHAQITGITYSCTLLVMTYGVVALVLYVTRAKKNGEKITNVQPRE